MTKILISVLLFCPLAVQSQDLRLAAKSASMFDAKPVGVTHLGSAVGLASAQRHGDSQFSFRPVLFGAGLGGAIGALIGHELGGTRSCPTAPDYACGQPAIGTAGGAAIGIALGATVGAVIGMRQRDASQARVTPLLNITDTAIGLRFACRL